MHTGTQNRDGDIANYLQVEGPAAVSSGRRISGLQNFSVEFLMKNASRALVGSAGLFSGVVRAQVGLNSVCLYSGCPSSKLFVIKSALPTAGIPRKTLPVEHVLMPGRSAKIVRTIVQRVAINMVNYSRDIGEIDSSAHRINDPLDEVFNPIDRNKSPSLVNGASHLSGPFRVVSAPPG